MQDKDFVPYEYRTKTVNAKDQTKAMDYKKLAEKKTKTLLPVIDDNEEKLANILEKGNGLLNADLI